MRARRGFVLRITSPVHAAAAGLARRRWGALLPASALATAVIYSLGDEWSEMNWEMSGVEIRKRTQYCYGDGTNRGASGLPASFIPVRTRTATHPLLGMCKCKLSNNAGLTFRGSN